MVLSLMFNGKILWRLSNVGEERNCNQNGTTQNWATNANKRQEWVYAWIDRNNNSSPRKSGRIQAKLMVSGNSACWQWHLPESSRQAWARLVGRRVWTVKEQELWILLVYESQAFVTWNVARWYPFAEREMKIYGQPALTLEKFRKSHGYSQSSATKGLPTNTLRATGHHLKETSRVERLSAGVTRWLCQWASMCLGFLCTWLYLKQHEYSSKGVRKGPCLVQPEERGKQWINSCCPSRESECYERRSGDREGLLRWREFLLELRSECQKWMPKGSLREACVK